MAELELGAKQYQNIKLDEYKSNYSGKFMKLDTLGMSKTIDISNR